MHVSGAEAAYAEIKQRIITLALPPGSTIHEAELSAALAIGRTPLREALHRLAHEGMVQIFPRRAILVAKLGLRDVRDIFELRSALETTAAGLAARRASDEHHRQLRSLLDDLESSRDHQDVRHFLEADQVFHRTIAQVANNRFLADAIDRTQDMNGWLWNIYFNIHAVRREALFGHVAIIEAIVAGDEAAARHEMDEHIRLSKEELINGL